MATKRFDKKLHEQNDERAPEIAKKYFSLHGYELRDNPDKYGVDLLGYRDGEFVMYVEVEIKRVWTEEDFPYGSVQFPERKWKFCNLDKPTAFFMINNKCNRALLVTGKDLVASPLKLVSNVYMRKDENFFQVPLDKVTFVEIQK
jgi:hypothetical protein